ncbi:hypothetical protein ACFPYN_00160 [Paenisporosarcina macmurdoensis]|uniref:Type 4 fimbrial biogenesis protein PilX N-terminal domain-containing protein n=1 Tax=Paenisporosarcina macmurdoensis TaxID=212659 RepID=A0ABW1L3U5_9BACL
MDQLKNQKGYILLIVLMLIIVFSVLGLSLLSLNITSAKQFNNKEKTVQARHTAEMGALHYKAYIAEEWKNLKNKNKSVINVFNGFNQGQRKQIKAEYLEKLNVNNNKFCDTIKAYSLETSEYTATNMTTDCSPAISDNLEWEFNVTIQNKPTVKNDKVVKLSATVKMNAPFYEVKDDWIGTPVNTGKNKKKNKDTYGKYKTLSVINEDVLMDDFSSDTKEWIQFNKSVYAKNSFNMKPMSCAIVKGDFRVDGSILFYSKATIFIYGDADLPSSLDYHNNHGGIFVAGRVSITGVLQPTNPYMGIDPKVNPGNCAVPNDFVIKEPSAIANEPVLTVIYN